MAEDYAKESSWFDGVCKLAQSLSLPPDDFHYFFEEPRDRIIYTVDLLREFGLKNKRICEIGFGGVGFACNQVLGAKVDAYDYTPRMKRLCEQLSIPWTFMDLNESAITDRGPYDGILLCEIIEHLGRWPAEILHELKEWLAPGGVLLVTTQNLHRLSNRVRMLAGKRLFADFVPEALILGHVREYTPEELVFLFERAGFQNVKRRLVTLPDINRSPLINVGYSTLCRVFPNLSNFLFCWATK